VLENLTGSLGCPSSAGSERAAAQDTTLSGVLVIDTVVTGFPLPSTAKDFLSQGSVADTRVVFRFDTLVNTFRHPNAAVDSNVTRVDSAAVRNRRHQLRQARRRSRWTADVDTTAADALPLALVPLFAPIA
jgi:hypothetical protein